MAANDTFWERAVYRRPFLAPATRKPFNSPQKLGSPFPHETYLAGTSSMSTLHFYNYQCMERGRR